MSFVFANGLRFNVEIQGMGEPLVLLHGFTGRAESWTEIAKALADGFQTIAIDLIGHGLSDAPSATPRYAFDLALDDLAGIVAGLGLVRASWLGYSMGGRLALGLALRHPALVTSLILESASPGIERAVERRARRAADDGLASRIEHIGVQSFVGEWEALPMWASQQALSRGTRQRQRNIRLKNRSIGLAGSLRGMGTGAQDSYWLRLDGVSSPTLLIAGSLDAKFAAIASRMSRLISYSELEIVPNAGHAVHLEQPAAYAERVSCFLENHRQRHEHTCGGG